MSPFDGGTPLSHIFAFVNQLCILPGSGNELVNLLAEQSPIYDGRPTAEAERLRGYILAGLERTGLPEAGMSFVIEELEGGHNPYVIAAAAKAARGAQTVPEHMGLLILDAIERISLADDFVCFDSTLGGAAQPPMTALMELFRTLSWLGSRASIALPALRAMLERQPPPFSDAVCIHAQNAVVALSCPVKSIATSCCPIEKTPSSSILAGDAQIDEVELQDQGGNIFSYRDFFVGRVGVLTFFYTRCINPNKCSLTITKLARLQQLVEQMPLRDHINIAGITYDPAFDLPRRLHSYGTSRGMLFNDRTRLMRTTGTFEPFRRWLGLGVGYGATTVNRHRLDMFVLNDGGRPAGRFARVQWQEKQVLEMLQTELMAGMTLIG